MEAKDPQVKPYRSVVVVAAAATGGGGGGGGISDGGDYAAADVVHGVGEGEEGRPLWRCW